MERVKSAEIKPCTDFPQDPERDLERDSRFRDLKRIVRHLEVISSC